VRARDPSSAVQQHGGGEGQGAHPPLQFSAHLP
jgi:hypothetical protein